MMYFDQRPLFIDNPFSMVSSREVLIPRLEVYNEIFSSHLNGKSVLDVACCDGRWSGWALDNNASHVTGFDINEEYINSGAKVIMPQYFDQSKYTFSVCDWENFIHPEHFDVTLLFGILHFGRAGELIQKFAESTNKILLDAVVNTSTVDGTHLGLADVTGPLESSGFSLSYAKNEYFGPDRYFIVATR